MTPWPSCERSQAAQLAVSVAAGGKTALLKALNGLEHMQGTLSFDDKPVRSAADRLAVRRHTGMVFQQPFLLSTTVL